MSDKTLRSPGEHGPHPAPAPRPGQRPRAPSLAAFPGPGRRFPAPRRRGLDGLRV